MAHLSIPERSFSDPSHLFGVRLEVIGWGVLLLAGITWLTRDVIPNRAATQTTATSVLSMAHAGTSTQLQQAFAAAQKANPAAANLVAEPNPALRGTFYLTVTADTPDKAQSGLAATTDAIRAALPAAAREDFSASPNKSTYPAPNDTTRRLGFVFRVAAVLLIVIAQVMIILGSYRQIGTDRATLLWKVAVPFLVVFLSPGGTGPGRRNAQRYYVPPDVIRFMFMLLPLSIIPLLLILWLTRKSKGAHDRRTIQQRRQGKTVR